MWVYTVRMCIWVCITLFHLKSSVVIVVLDFKASAKCMAPSESMLLFRRSKKDSCRSGLLSFDMASARYLHPMAPIWFHSYWSYNTIISTSFCYFVDIISISYIAHYISCFELGLIYVKRIEHSRIPKRDVATTCFALEKLKELELLRIYWLEVSHF